MSETDFLDDPGFDPVRNDESDQVLAGLEEVNQKLEGKRGKKKAADKAEQKEEEKKPKYTTEELLKVFDALVFEGTYEETFQGRGISLTLRSRTGEDAIAISRAMDRFEGKTFMSVQTYSLMMTLVYSMVSFNGKTFGQKDVKSKYEFLTKLPDPLLAILYDKMQEFDEKITEAIKEGRKNF